METTKTAARLAHCAFLTAWISMKLGILAWGGKPGGFHDVSGEKLAAVTRLCGNTPCSTPPVTGGAPSGRVADEVPRRVATPHARVRAPRSASDTDATHHSRGSEPCR